MLKDTQRDTCALALSGNVWRAMNRLTAQKETHAIQLQRHAA